MRREEESIESIVHRLERFDLLLQSHKADIYPNVREHYRAAYQECLYKLGNMGAHSEFMVYSNHLLRYDVEVKEARKHTAATLTRGFPEGVHKEEEPEEPWEAGG